MNLPTLDKLSLKDKTILLRLDLDLPIDRSKVVDDTRLQASLPTIEYLLEKDCRRITILGHRGRPGGKAVESLSLEPLAFYLEEILEKKLGKRKLKELEMYMMENLRFNSGEESNDEHYAEHLAEEGDVFVNDAFAASHREHASIVGLPQFLPHAAGLHLVKEVENLSRVLENPKKPVVFLIGGGKTDKAELVSDLAKKSDTLLLGGALPKQEKSWPKNSKVAKLIRGGNDIDAASAKDFTRAIKGAGTIVWNGPLGDIDQGFEQGTEQIAQALAKSGAFKVVGGGDTIAFLKKEGFLVKIDWISTGGGAMLEFLAFGDLPGLKALRARQRQSPAYGG